MTTASRRYYRAMCGTWCGRLDTKITDRGALAAAKLGTLDRLAWKLSAGRPWLETSVAFADGKTNEVIHETRVRQLGRIAVEGVEIIALEPDSNRFTMRGTHRFAWTPWKKRAVEGTGEVREAADGATYVFEYLGAPLTQTTRTDGEALIVTQTTAFSRGEVKLERCSPRRAGPARMIASAVVAALAFAWLWPDLLTLLVCPGGPLVFVVLLLDARPRTIVAVFTALAAMLATRWGGDALADRGLDVLRREIVEYRTSTGHYPRDLDQLGTVPSAGLPGTRRTYSYVFSDRLETPLLFYTYLAPFGRRFIDVETGHPHDVD